MKELSLRAKIYHYSVLGVVFLFLFLPILATLLYSLSTSWSVSVLPDDLTLKWYAALLDDERCLASIAHSLYVCFMALLIVFLITFPVVFAVNYYFLRAKGFFNFLAILPFAVAPIVSCVGLLQIYAESLVGTPYILFFTYTMIAYPFVYRALDNAFASLSLNELIASNAILGGSIIGAIFKLILPNLFQGIIVAVFLSFSFLIGEFLFANILVGSIYETLQVYLYNIKGQSGHYSSAIVMVYFALIFISTFIATLFSKKD